MSIYRKFDDKELEAMWEELEDVLVYEDECGRLCLQADWQGFEAGTDQEEIWRWFDEHHSKGVGWLMNEYEPEWVREIKKPIEEALGAELRIEKKTKENEEYFASNFFYECINILPKEPFEGCEYWTTGDMVMCINEEKANLLADILDELAGGVIACTGYYDPVEDERSGEVDRCTGYWYVDIS